MLKVKFITTRSLLDQIRENIEKSTNDAIKRLRRKGILELTQKGLNKPGINEVEAIINCRKIKKPFGYGILPKDILTSLLKNSNMLKRFK